MSALRNTSFLIEVAKGNIPGHSTVEVIGYNGNVGSSLEDVWDQGGAYTDTTTAAIHYISSSSALDVTNVMVTYLDEDWMQQIIIVTLAGQTKTQIGTGELMMRVQVAKNDGAAAFVGDVYIYEDDTLTAGVPNTATKIRGKLTIDHGRSVMAKWAIPADKTGFLLSTLVSTALSKNTEMIFVIREFGKTYLTYQHLGIISDYIPDNSESYSRIEPKSDMKCRAAAVGAGGAVNASFSLLLVDTTLLGSNS